MLCYAMLSCDKPTPFVPKRRGMADGCRQAYFSLAARAGGGAAHDHDPDARLLSVWGEGSTSLLVLGELASPTDGESPKGRAPDLTSGAVGEPLLRTLLVPGP